MRLEFDATQFHFAVQVRVRWADSDAVGIAYNGAYLTWLEVARVEFFRSLKAFQRGLPRSDASLQDHLFEPQDGTYSLVSSQLNWRTPARVDARLRVATRVSRIGSTSFEHQYLLTHAGSGEVVALGETTQVRVDPATLRPMDLGAPTREGLEAFSRALAEGRVDESLRFVLA